jgi:hypothetical protein
MKILFLAMFASLFMGCASNKAVIPPPFESAREYRELQGQLTSQQTDIAISGQRIEDQGRGIVEDLIRIERDMADTQDVGEKERQSWLSEVKVARTDAEIQQTLIEDLNRQLAAERETVKKKDQEFTLYEFSSNKELSVKTTENATLREGIRTVRGQRNTVIGILITAGVFVLIYFGMKILRFLKILP